MYMHHAPKNWSSVYMHCTPIGLVSHTTVYMWQRISLYSPQHWAHGTILKCVCGGGGVFLLSKMNNKIILYTSLHVEVHEFIFNRDAYDCVIEKVVGYHSLMRFLNFYSWPK